MAHYCDLALKWMGRSQPILCMSSEHCKSAKTLRVRFFGLEVRDLQGDVPPCCSWLQHQSPPKGLLEDSVPAPTLVTAK